MILPERVLGRSSAQMIRFGRPELADLAGHVLADVGDHVVVALLVAGERHERRDRLPVSSSCWPITAASATLSCETIADSTSAVEAGGRTR